MPEIWWTAAGDPPITASTAPSTSTTAFPSPCNFDLDAALPAYTSMTPATAPALPSASVPSPLYALSTTDLYFHSLRHSAAAATTHVPSLDNALFLIYTSGTTGPSKAARFTHRRFIGAGLSWTRPMRLLQTQRYYVTLPLFHGSVTVCVCVCVCVCVLVVTAASLPLSLSHSALLCSALLCFALLCVGWFGGVVLCAACCVLCCMLCAASV